MKCLLFLIAVCQGLIYFGTGPYAGVDQDTIIHKSQFGGDYETSAFNTNISFVLAPSGCPSGWDSSFSPLGKAVWINALGKPCDFADFQREVTVRGGIGLFMGTPVPAITMMGWQGNFLRGGVPAFSTQSSTNPYGTIDANVFPGSLLFGLIPGAFNENITALLTPPKQNIIYRDMNNQVSGHQILSTIGIILSASLFALSVAKIFTFHQFMGGIQFTIPFVVFFCCCGVGIFGCLRSITGQDGVWVWFNSEIPQFFNFWTLGWAFSSSILLGLYFRELSTLTSAQESPVLNAMFWPAVVIIGFMWIGILIVGGVTVNEPSSADTNGNLAALQLAVIVIAAFVMMVVVMWGSLSLLLSFAGTSDSSKALLVKVILLSVLQMIVLVPTGVFFTVAYNYPETTVSLYLNTVQVIWLDVGLSVYGPVVASFIILFNFRISVSKEIEVSKSGTSSTSSGSSSSSNSSSSSASNDPVIEL